MFVIVLFKLLISILCLIGIVNPRLSWQLSEGWKYKDAEPSEIYLIMTRIMAIVTLIVIWLMFRF